MTRASLVYRRLIKAVARSIDVKKAAVDRNLELRNSETRLGRERI